MSGSSPRRRRGGLVLALLVAAAAVAMTTTSVRGDAAPAACGVERWAVKTLQDDAGRSLDLSTIVKTTVSALRAKPVQRGPGGSRGAGVESTFYEVRARLVSAKLEEDNDIHLIIKGITTSGTMIVEFPLAPTCGANATTGAKTRMKNSRNAFGSARGGRDAAFLRVPGNSSPRGSSGRTRCRARGRRACRTRARPSVRVRGRASRRPATRSPGEPIARS